MTPQERQMVTELFDRLARLEKHAARRATPSGRSPKG